MYARSASSHRIQPTPNILFLTLLHVLRVCMHVCGMCTCAFRAPGHVCMYVEASVTLYLYEFLCVWLFCLTMCLCTRCTQCPQRPEEGIGIGSLGAGATDSHGHQGLNSDFFA